MPPRRRRQTKRARNREFGRRETPLVVRGALACRGCFGRAQNAFRPKEGLPLEVSCSMANPGSSSCVGCQNGHDTCTPLPAMLQFDATRLEELLSWSFNAFGPQREGNGELDDAVAYDADGAVEVRVEYEARVLERRQLRLQAIQPLAVDANDRQRATHRRQTTLRAEPLDAGYSAWLLAVRAFMAEVEDIVVDELSEDDWDTIMEMMVNQDVIHFVTV
ncbi:hypothetical protein F4801DRAFT_586014 [Xylaria longipes]|nr:hypothetical protein F4801DRAFT_586014 [Xylaria longipes]RYC53833.1 hypothetical protein CHU98_g12377 [Xylaria longipes]